MNDALANAPRPGRPKGSSNGRTKALGLLDRLFTEEPYGPRNLTTLKKALQKSFSANPLKFFTDFIIPLRPRDFTMNISNTTPGHTTLTPDQMALSMDALTIGMAPVEEDAEESTPKPTKKTRVRLNK